MNFECLFGTKTVQHSIPQWKQNRSHKNQFQGGRQHLSLYIRGDVAYPLNLMINSKKYIKKAV